MSTNKKLTIFMLPWLAHGHISPFLELAKKLSQKNIFIYFCSTPINLTSMKNQITHLKNIQVIELNLPSSPNLPPHLHTTNGLPTHLFPNLRAAIDSARPDFARILKGLEPDLLIHDIALQWSADIASSLNIANVQFVTFSAVSISFILHMVACPGVDYPFPGIYLRDFELSAMLKLLQIPAGGGDGAAGKEEENKLREILQGSSTIVLIKSLKEIEGKYMDYFSLLNKKKVVSVGSLMRDSSHDDESSDIIEWLDEKNSCSTVFVSFGSEYFLSKDEITEIAYGLELSGVNFVWVIRFPKGEEISSVVEGAIFPEDFLEKVRERGRIVKGWAPQARILGHPSVGGFVSHCGWSSVMGRGKIRNLLSSSTSTKPQAQVMMIEHMGVCCSIKKDFERYKRVGWGLSKLSSWNEDDYTPYNWAGVKCDRRNNRVTDLNLSGYSLSGHIGRSLLKLDSLRTLSLSNNNFTGTLNPIITQIQNLRFIDFSQNGLSGSIPEEFFDQCRSLIAISISKNYLTGPVPQSLSSCSTLERVNFSSNFLSGTLPTGIWSLIWGRGVRTSGVDVD